MNKNEQVAVLQGLLFIAGSEGLTIAQLASCLSLSSALISDHLIPTLQTKLDSDESCGLTIIKVGDFYKLTTKAQHHEHYQVLTTLPLMRLSQAALETLAIIAYKHPITKPQIEDIRGVNCDSIIFKLKNLNLICEIGRSDLPGRPLLYELTPEFMDHFNIESLTQLPELPQFEQLADEEIYHFSHE